MVSLDAVDVIIGVDIGTTSTKSVAYDVGGRARTSHGIGYPLHEPFPGYAEQDPDEILAAVLGTIREVAASGDRVVGLSFSTAMHSLVGLDADGVPLTPSVTWADGRASRQAERIRSSAAGLALHRRTGTPVHPMSPLPKLVWFHEQEPKLCERVASWVGIKDYVLLRLCEALVVDASTASATGLLDLERMMWDAEALQLAGITAEQLPELVPTTTVLPGLTAAAAVATGLPASTPVVVGAGDGPLANLGLGAVRPGVAACSIGTSGALRVMVDRPAVDPLGGVFCYALTEGHWAVGGAINNGGIVLDWAAGALAPDLAEPAAEELLALAAKAPVGCGGLVMLPYLLSERAPHWSSLPRGAYIGLTRDHRREHLVRAALEGVCQQLSLVLQSMRSAGIEVREVRATGGFARSPLWRQILADTPGMPVHFPAGHEGSSFGAALLGLQALGLVDTIDIAADLVELAETVHPDAASAATYAALLPVFAQLYDALVPTFVALRRLAPGLPIDVPDPQELTMPDLHHALRAAESTASNGVLVTAALLGIGVVVLLITVGKVHPFLALIGGAAVLGLVAGLGADETITSFSAGVGTTVGGVGLLIALGAMIGGLLADSGGADSIVERVVNSVSERRLPWAMAGVAALIGLPLFFEVGVVLLVPVVLLVSTRTSVPLMKLGIPALAGLSVLHGLVPPHPGPLVAISALKADLGLTLAFGLVIAVPAVILAGPVFGSYIGNRIHATAPTALLPTHELVGATGDGRSSSGAADLANPAELAGDEDRPAARTRPAFGPAVVTILVPVVLMLLRALGELLLDEGSGLRDVLTLIGTPIVALLAGLVLAMVTMGFRAGFSRSEVSTTVGAALPAIAGILLIVGAGGGFKQVLIDAGVGDVVAAAAKDANVSALVLGWLVAVGIRLATGSATVATITAAGIVAPLAAGLPNAEVSLLVLAIGSGSLFFSHVNDAGFWLVKEYFGLTVGETIRSWSVMETIISVVGLVGVLLLNVVV